MAIFRRNSKSSDHSGEHQKVHLTKEDAQHYKIRSSSVHDPVLGAVSEAQPFEVAGDQIDQTRESYMTGQGLVDVFGKRIQRPDISNPTRSRDERPLDTIRSFEYSITGDLSYKDRLESDVLGFRVRDDFPRFGSNPYGAQQSQSQPVHSFSGDDGFEQGVYQAPVKVEGATKKKKRGLFGKKK